MLRPRARPLTSRPLGQLLVQVPQAPLEGRSLWAFRAQGWLLGPRPALAAEVRAPVFPPHRGLSSVGPGRGLRPCQCRSGPTRTWGTRSAAEAGGSTHLPSHVGNTGPRDGAPGSSLPLDLWAGRGRELGSGELDSSGACQLRQCPGAVYSQAPQAVEPSTAGSRRAREPATPRAHVGTTVPEPAAQMSEGSGYSWTRRACFTPPGVLGGRPPTRGPGQQQPGVTPRVPSLCPGVGGAAASLPIHSQGLGSWDDGLCRQQS